MKKLHLDVDRDGKPLFHAVPESEPKYHEMSFKESFPTQEDIACELQLTAIGDFVPLNFNIKGWKEDELNLNQYWVPFQPKENIINDRESILVYGPENANPSDACGLSQLKRIHGYKPSEMSMNFPTEAKEKLSCFSSFFDYFDFGRTFLVKLNAGGHYPPHRDHVLLNRPSFRLIAFIPNKVSYLRWEIDDKIINFDTNTIYYVDTRKAHRLWSSGKNSTMLVCNIKKDWNNILKLLSVLKDK
jgi:hypothetical protein